MKIKIFKSSLINACSNNQQLCLGKTVILPVLVEEDARALVLVGGVERDGNVSSSKSSKPFERMAEPFRLL